MRYLIIDKKQRVKIKGKFPYASMRIMEELKKKNLDFDFVYFDQIEIIFKNSKLSILANGREISNYSHILFRGHFANEARHYETKLLIADYIEQGNRTKGATRIKALNSRAILSLPYYNKIWFTWICAKNDIPFLDTYYRLDGRYSVERDFLVEYPLIIKEYSGTNDARTTDGDIKVKKNVYKLENDSDYKQEFLKDKDLKNFFIQEFSDAGEDIRIFVSKNKVIGGWRRKAKKGFMTVSKGEYTMYNKPSKDIENLAIKTSKAFKADFIATDFMFKNGKPYLQEISFHPGFEAYEQKTKGDKPVNIAKAIIESF